MRGRPAAYSTQAVVEKAQKVFWKKGYTATSLEDLLAATGMGSGSFYNAFKGGKKELFKKALHQRREAFAEFKEKLRASDTPLELVKDFFRSIAQADKPTHMRGCIIANAVVEMAALDKELEDEAVTILKETEALYTEAIALAQKKGMLKNTTEPAILGRYLITLWNGINVTRRMYPDTSILSQQIEMHLDILR